MKQGKIKLRWQVFALVVVFAGIIILVFCFFQIFMLDYFYKQNKINTAGELVDEALEIVENNANYTDALNNLGREKDASIYIIATNPSNNYLNAWYCSRSEYYELIIDNMNTIVKSNTNGKFYITFESKLPNHFYDGPLIDDTKISTSNDKDIICCEFVKINGISFLLCIDSRLSAIQPAVDTMQQQLFVISIIVIVLSVLVALVISKIISKPIKRMTEDAQLLATGRRDIEFNGTGYFEIVELNRTLNYAVTELNKTDTLQKELLANISHDLKTPLTLIAGYAEMMKDIPSEINEANLQLIVDESNRLNLLVNDVLNLSRLQAKTEVFNMEKFDLTVLIKSICERISKLRKNDYEILFDEESLFINGDIHKIEQVLQNFITNAINYGKDSKRIEVFYEICDNNVKVNVKDYGIGINEEDLSCIWNRYYRVDKGHQRSHNGTGLGLAICKEILDYHKFKYGVISKINEGSTFYFEAPIEK